MELVLILACVSLFLVILNNFSIRVVKNKSFSTSNSISVLIPMRNEELNVQECINAVVNQSGLHNYEILVLDDESSDQTLSELRKFSSIKIIEGQPTPQGWLGKLWACHQLAEHSTGEYLVFLDADVRLSKNAISSALNSMQGWDFISPYPRQLTAGFLQRVFQPLLQWSWLASVPLLLTYKFPIKSMTIANGQFFIVKKSAYLKSGGHFKIKGEVLDDLMLARQLITSGFRGSVAEASQVATCKMYNTNMELIRGYQKSLYKAFGNPIGVVFTLAILVLNGIVPIVAAMQGSNLALWAFVLIFLSRVFASLRTGGIPSTALLHPVAVGLLIILIFYSWYGRLTKTLTWRDRNIIHG